MSIYRVLLFLCFLCVIGITPLQAQTPCQISNGDGRPNSQYPELDSTCTSVQDVGSYVTISGNIAGSRYPTHDEDPTCGDAQWQVTCRRICGELPRGRRAGSLGTSSITPRGWARFELHLEVFDKGDHDKVCLRAKNWSAGGWLSIGQTKTFIYMVSYAQPPAPPQLPPPVWPKEVTVVKGDCLSTIAQTAYGSQIWPKVYRANKTKIKSPDLIFPDQKLSLPK